MSKVVTLLEDMRGELVSEREAADESFQKLTCFCQTTQKQLKASIEAGSAKISQLKADIQEGTAKAAMLTEELAKEKKDLASNTDALSTQTELNSKETKENVAEQKTTEEAIAALTGALEKLQAKGASLAQFRSAAKDLQEAGIMSLTVLGGHETVALKAFLREAEDLKPSFLQSGGPFKSYGSQTGKVVGILSQMKEDFIKHLEDLKAQAEKNKEEFASFKLAKEAEINSGSDHAKKLQLDLAATSTDLSDDKGELSSTEGELKDNIKLLGESEQSCEEDTTQYEAETASRLEEMKAVEETIKILDSDEAFGLAEKTLSFLQTATSISASQQEQMKRRRASLLLQRAAASTDAPWLALLSSKLIESPFAVVIEKIEEMLQELSKQQEDEVTSKTECDSELKSTADDLAAAEMSKTDLTVAIEKLNKNLKETMSGITTNKEQVKLKGDSKAKMTQIYEEASANFKQEEFDQTAMIDILTKAIQRLQAVYSMIQSPVQVKPVAPGKNAGGKIVIQMLETISTDAKKSLDEARNFQSERTKAYEKGIKTLDAAMKVAQENIATLTAKKAGIAEELAKTKKDSSAAETRVTNLGATKEDLHEECDWLLENFSVRQASRLKEIEALKEATTLLK